MAKTLEDVGEFLGAVLPQLPAWAPVISASAITIVAIFTYFQIRAARKQFELQKLAERTRSFMMIADRWSEIYNVRNAALGGSILTRDELLTKYQRNYKKFLASAEWKELRPLCNFFELLGTVLHRKYIDPDDLFVLVTVDVFKENNDGTEEHVPEGVMYSRLKGPIEYLREVYRSDIYWFYDQYLLTRYKKHIPRLPRP